MYFYPIFFSALCFFSAPLLADPPSKPFTFGNTLVTKFSGTVLGVDEKDLNPTNHLINETFIDPTGAAAIILNTHTPDNIWRGQLLKVEKKQSFPIPALAVGQVFSATYDSAGNAYLAATSSYGLNLIKPDICERDRLDKKGNSLCETIDKTDIDRLPERITTGHPSARWMVGQFGKTGSPGSVWKVDGHSGKISLFTNITLAGVANSGAALGDISFDEAHNQFFVSDMDTGMVHRISNTAKHRGEELDFFDHGITARTVLSFPVIKHNNDDRIDITSEKFKPLDQKTWGFSQLGRQVWALKVYKNRLYYSVWNGEELGSEIWSVALDIDGRFSEDIRLEISVAKYQGHLKITDITFSKQGAMILAQRGAIATSYDYKIAIESSDARVLRYWLEQPNDPQTNSMWVSQAEEYAVGMADDHRNSSGGVALGYGYNEQGVLDTQSCKDALWTTGHSLTKEGSKSVSGLQGSPSRPVRNFNTPPTTSYFFDVYPESEIEAVQGWLGDVEIYTQGCVCQNICAISAASDQKPVIVKLPANSSPPEINLPEPPEFPELPDFPEFPEWCPYGLCVITVVCIPPLDFWPWCGSEEDELPACMEMAMSPAGPFLNGSTWSMPMGVTSLNNNTIDTLRIFSNTSGVNITNGNIFSVGFPTPTFTATANQDAVFDLCGYNSADAQTGKPYDCCSMKVKFKVRESQSAEDHQTLEVVQ
ncbi:MAG: hypothetical protein HRU06_19090 [Oceanospirillaceae bacterium]|nr:hypothetical protein [Oceanospirillaceae bacterium]